MVVLTRTVLAPVVALAGWLRHRIDMPALFAVGEPARPGAPHPWAAQLPYFAKDRD